MLQGREKPLRLLHILMPLRGSGLPAFMLLPASRRLNAGSTRIRQILENTPSHSTQVNCVRLNFGAACGASWRCSATSVFVVQPTSSSIGTFSQLFPAFSTSWPRRLAPVSCLLVRLLSPGHQLRRRSDGDAWRRLDAGRESGLGARGRSDGRLSAALLTACCSAVAAVRGLCSHRLLCPPRCAALDVGASTSMSLVCVSRVSVYKECISAPRA